MPYIERSVLPRLRNTNLSKTFVTAVTPVYLGMPPLPIGIMPPVKPPFPTGGDKVAAVSISGIGTGGVVIGAKPTGTKNGGIRRKATTVGSKRRTSSKGKNTNSTSTPKKKKKARGKILGRNGNGQFKKGGK